MAGEAGLMRGAAAPTPAVDLAAAARSQRATPAFDIVRIAKDGRMVLAGRGPANARITVLDGDTPIGQVEADGRGEWVLVAERPLPGGSRELRLSALLPSGDRVASAAPVVVLVPEPSTGAAASPVVIGLAAAPRQPSRLLQAPDRPPGQGDRLSLDAIDYDEVGNVVVSGTAPAGGAIRVYLDNRPIGTARAEGRDWRLISDGEIAAGHYTLRIDQLGPDGKVAGRLEAPFTRAAPAEIATAKADDHVVIQPGNNLWRIARRTYGRGVLYTVIYRANADRIRDPDLIYPGQIFALPQNQG
jgi:nucleoid-associated protein YgaU